MPWIKVEHDIFDKPEVAYLAESMDEDVFTVVGRLVYLWTWFDRHGIDGVVENVTESSLARILRNADVTLGSLPSEDLPLDAPNKDTKSSLLVGLLREVGWLIFDVNKREVRQVNFDRHGSKSAKERALAAKRVRKHRLNKAIVSKSLPEKRREEKTPNGVSPSNNDGGWASEVAAWNRLAENHGLPRLQRLTKLRKQKISSRRAEFGDFWDRLDEALGSRVSRGTHDAGFLTIDWILDSEQRLTRVLEGQFANAFAGGRKRPSAKRQDFGAGR